MSEYILIDVSKHNKENRTYIRDFLISQGLIVCRGEVRTSGASTFEVIE
tara:strand:+ start:805 stop:951 length:147 start_codon:yes stop_codon:yes gene_type:complete